MSSASEDIHDTKDGTTGDAGGAMAGEQFKAVVRRLGPVGPLAIVAASLPAIGGFVLLGFVSRIAPWLRDHEGPGVLVYVTGFTLLAGLALLPTYAQALLGGFAFGFVVGFSAAIAGFVGAAILGYAIASRASGDRVVRLIEEQPKWKAVWEALVGRGPWRTLGIVTLLRMPPNSPFAITNLVMASAGVRPLPFVLGTLFGMAPRTAAFVFIGAGMSNIDFDQPKPTWLWIGGIGLALVAVAIIGVIANHAIAKVTMGKPAESPASRAATSADR